MNFLKVIVEVLKKNGLFINVFSLYSLINPSLRKLRQHELNELASFTKKIGHVLQQPLYKSHGNQKVMLILGMSGVRYIAQETVVRKSFELAGYRCKVLVSQDKTTVEAYSCLGSDEIIFIDQFQPKLPNKGAKLLEGCNSLEDVLNIKSKNIRCGKYAVSTLMRKTRSGSINLSEIYVKDQLCEALNQSL